MTKQVGIFSLPIYFSPRYQHNGLKMG